MFDARNSPFGNMTWFVGTIESIQDPEMLDRVQVRCFGFHSDDRSAIATEHLPWAPFAGGGARMSSPMVLPGNMCMGFFMDGNQAQQPVVLCVWTGIPTQKNKNNGFSDPTGVYPKVLNQPDNSPLARGANSVPAIYSAATLAQNINTAGGGTFSEPKTAYAPKYPSNHVLHTDAGQIIELDDTPGAERVQIFHRMGSFIEFHPDGKIVHRSLKDNYEIMFANNNMYVAGDLNVSVGGSINYAAGKDINFSAGGKITQIAGGMLSISAGSDASFIAGSSLKISAGSDATIASGGDSSIQAGGDAKINGSSLDLGASGSASLAGSTVSIEGGSASIQAGDITVGTVQAGPVSPSFTGTGGSGSGASASPDSPATPVTVAVLTANAAANTSG